MLHFVKRGRPSRSTGKAKRQSESVRWRNTGENTMSITVTQLKDIRQNLAMLTPGFTTLDGNVS